MKSTYKLFGTYWDHRKSIYLDEIPIGQFRYRNDYKYPYCLFDLIGECRTISISELLSIEKDEEFISICCRLSRYKLIAIVLDYITNPASLISSEFFMKRMGQIYYSLQYALPDSKIVIQIPSEKIAEWDELRKLVP